MKSEITCDPSNHYGYLGMYIHTFAKADSTVIDRRCLDSGVGFHVQRLTGHRRFPLCDSGALDSGAIIKLTVVTQVYTIRLQRSRSNFFNGSAWKQSSFQDHSLERVACKPVPLARHKASIYHKNRDEQWQLMRFLTWVKNW